MSKNILIRADIKNDSKQKELLNQLTETLKRMNSVFKVVSSDNYVIDDSYSLIFNLDINSDLNMSLKKNRLINFIKNSNYDQLNNINFFTKRRIKKNLSDSFFNIYLDNSSKLATNKIIKSFNASNDLVYELEYNNLELLMEVFIHE